MQNQHHYNVTQILLNVASGVVTEPIDITSTMDELVLTESVFRGFLTGRLTVIDDRSLYDFHKFSGVETIDITVDYNDAVLSNPPPAAISKRFYLRNIKMSHDTNNESRIVIFDLIEPHGYIDNTLKLSRTFEGQGPEMIQGALSHLDVTLNREGVSENPPMQGKFKYNSPYLSPLEICEVIRSRLTTKPGSPFFLTSSVFGPENEMRLLSYDDVMRNPPKNSNTPYVYSEAVTNYFELEPSKRPFIVGAFYEEEIEDTFVFTQRGGLFVDYASHDVFNGREYKQDVFVGDHLDTLIERGVLRGPDQTVYNREEAIRGNAREVYSITSGNSFSSGKNIHDVFDAAEANKKIRPMQLLSAMERNSKKLSVRGFGMMLLKMSAGDSIAVRILDSRLPKNEEDETSNFDVRRSGNYFIMETKHIFRHTDHVINMRVSKLDELPPNEGPQ